MAKSADKKSSLVGKRAPAVKLQNQDGETVDLGKLRGQWIVLYFYPRDNTPGCTTEACEFTAMFPRFRKLKAKVFGCSPDSPEAHRKFIAKNKLAIDLLSDPHHEVLEAFGAWGEKSLYGNKFVGVLRSTVIVDPEGRVAYHWPKVKAAGHAVAVREKLAELQARV